MTEFTISLSHTPGHLAALCEALTESGLSIEAVAAFGIDGDAVVHLMTDDEPTTKAVLRRLGVAFSERQVIVTTLPREPGALAEMTRDLANSEVNIESLYLLRSSNEGLEFAVAVDPMEPRSRIAS